MLNGLARPSNCNQDEGVREDDDGTWEYITEKKKTDDVRHGKDIVGWIVP